MTTAQLLCLLALLAALLAYTQTRWWIITRYVLIKLLHPIRLSDTDETSFDNLAQGEALLSLLSKGRRRRAATSETFMSPWFGIVSLFDVLVFLAAGPRSSFPYGRRFWPSRSSCSTIRGLSRI
jgi:hypothetical protein